MSAEIRNSVRSNNLAARKLNEIGHKPCPARECAISEAISSAELILKSIETNAGPADVR